MNYSLYLKLFSLFSFCILSACSTINVNQRSSAKSLTHVRANIITHNQLSNATRAMLASANQDETRCMGNLATCVKSLKKTAQLNRTDIHATLAEIYLASAQTLAQTNTCQAGLAPASNQPTAPEHQKSRPHVYVGLAQAEVSACIQRYEQALTETIRFSYAYLFLDSAETRRTFSNRRVQVRDFYNQATSDLIASVFERTKKQKSLLKFKVANNQFKVWLEPTPQSSSVASQKSKRLHDITSAHNLAFSGLRTQSKREGFGVNHVAVYEDPSKNTISNLLFDKDTKDKTLNKTLRQRIHQSHYLPISIIVEPVGKSLEQVLHSQEFVVRVIDPYQVENVTIQNRNYQLAANFSAPYGIWLANRRYGQQQYISLLSGMQALQKPQLFMLEPYDPNKRVIVMLHGLASSPETWVNLTNDVLGDETLRRHYQVWQVFYSTNLPMIENRYDIYALLKTAYKTVDKRGTHRASQHSVLVGHSMGSVIGRMLVSNTDLRKAALQDLDTKTRRSFSKSRTFNRRFKLQSLPQFDRAVFIAGPFRGTPFADRWFTKALRRVIQLPSAFVGEINNVFRSVAKHQNGEKLSGLQSLFLNNGADQLSDQSAFVSVTKDVRITPKVTYHTIMGKQQPNLPLAESSDGIVPYTSARLAGAASEKVIDGDHSVHTQPDAVLELRRILRDQLYKTDGIAKPQSTISQAAVNAAEEITQEISQTTQQQQPATTN